MCDEGGKHYGKRTGSRRYCYGKKDIGEVKIASDVVSVIAALAATEVEGVSSMAGMNKFGVKNTKGVRVIMNEGRVHVDMVINVKYGYSIPKISKQVQSRVGQQIETMTGLKVSGVNVRVAGVNLDA